MRRPLAGLCVLFDLDGTLIDTAEDLGAAMNHALQTAGYDPAPPARVRGFIGGGARAMLVRGLAEIGAPSPSAEDLDTLTGHFIDYYSRNIAAHSRPFPGVLDVIENLRSDGAVAAICTNKRERLARALIDALGIERHFAAIIGGDTVGVAKPSARPVLACLEKSGAQTGVFVGDSDTDIKAAKAAGMPCLTVSFGYGPLDHQHEAFALFDHYHEAPALIRRAATSRA